MKKWLGLAALLLILFLGIIGFRLFLTPSSLHLSPDQQDMVDLFGNPDAFTISYLPRGSQDNPQLVRMEIWQYRQPAIKVSFLAGDIVDQAQIDSVTTNSTQLLPQNFHWDQSYSDLEKIFGIEQIEPIDFLPGISDDTESITSYLTPQALFVVEHDHLSYFQTIDLVIDSDNQELFQETTQVSTSPTTAPTPNIDNWIDYTSPEGFTLRHPADWFVDADVITTYDANNLEVVNHPPDTALKCDLLPSQYALGIEFIDTQTLSSQPIITKGNIIDTMAEQGMGIVDGVGFHISGSNELDLTLICYLYDSSFQDDLIKLLSSISYQEAR